MNNPNIYKNNSVRIIAGPCAFEDDYQIDQICQCLKNNGLSWMRGGIFKPRTNAYAFQGLGYDALNMVLKYSSKYSLYTVTEVTDVEQVHKLLKYVDALQIGARNMTNYELLKKIGKFTSDFNTPIILKRGFSSTISELLMASEYISSNGNNNIMLCERGLRTFEDSTRFTLDISSVPVIHKQSKIPVCVDVSHAAGSSDLVPSLAKAALAAGADAIMIEIHPSPRDAKCDGQQQLNLNQFSLLIKELKKIALSLDKTIV